MYSSYGTLYNSKKLSEPYMKRFPGGYRGNVCHPHFPRKPKDSFSTLRDALCLGLWYKDR